MTQISLFFWIRLAIGLIAGFWLAWRLRGPLRALVVRLLPVRLRISEASFQLQTRYSTLAAFLLAFLIAGLFVWGTDALFRALKRPAPSPPAERPAEPLEPTRYSLGFPGATDPATPDTLPPDEVKPKAAPAAQADFEAQPVAPSGLYLQIYAFRQETRASRQQEYWRSRLSHPVLVVRMEENGLIWHKVLIGPFPNRRELQQFKRQLKMKGFPRSAEGLPLPDSE